MSPAVISSLLAEPAVADPPRRVRRDWVLLAVMVPTAIVEGVVSDRVSWFPASGVVVVAMIVATALWRRTHPLAVTLTTFGLLVAADAVAAIRGDAPFEYYSAALLLVGVYALFRWGSGREAAIGLAAMAVAFASTMITNWTTLGDAIGGALVLFFPAALGVEVRHLVGARARDLADAKLLEREMLARELHDSVAHHVSAIAVRAQAGRLLGASEPAEALDALEVIEREASRTLVEMRAIVGTLRGSQGPELSPRPGLAEVVGLAAPDVGPRVEIHLDDDLGDIAETVGTALYRVSQEAITNARRHAHDATTVEVSITGENDRVLLRVDDDGRPAPASRTPRSEGGFGLVGMAERVHLLGGTFAAGPRSTDGWRVDATIPRGGPR
ncbi:sensor histidine kinase [Ilumatobacter sp.]|uniref:sensor histidine kinase n=1 Tax=Ilumatobacter sp. TaxID=1967498 RepID=UPI003B51D97D